MPRTTTNRAAALARCLLCAALCIAMAPGLAFGEVRKGDLIAGETVELRGMPASSAPAIAANRSILVDSDGRVYFERAADERCQIASITKMMTAVVALDAAPLDLPVSVSERAAATGESTANLKEGDAMPLSEALVGLMVPSGNDAAVAIAESVGAHLVDQAREGGASILDVSGDVIDLASETAAYDAFVAKMNERARELGCADTLFTNPHGLDFDEWESENPYSTARDIAKIASYAMRNEAFREVVSLDGATMALTRDGAEKRSELESTDELLGAYEGACGIKTGFTDKAGQCFAGACQRDGRYLYAVVLDSSTNEQRFEDARSLYDWAYASEIDYRLANSDEAASMEIDGVRTDVPVVGRAALAAWPERTVPVTLADPEATVRVSSIFGNVSQDVTFDEIPGGVDAGEVVGRVDFYQDNARIASQDLIACESVEEPGFLDVVAGGWRSLCGLFGAGQEGASSVVLNKTPLLLPKN